MSITGSLIGQFIFPPALAKEHGINLALPFAPGGGHYNTFNEYFVALITYGIGLAAAIAVLIVVYAGTVYARSGGAADKIAEAKEWSAGALTGLAILLLIRLILPTLGIDPGKPT